MEIYEYDNLKQMGKVKKVDPFEIIINIKILDIDSRK
jgi:hypothetical protein